MTAPTRSQAPSADDNALFPPPLLLFADDQAEQEIFPRIANWLNWSYGEDGKAIYGESIARPGEIVATPFFDLAWSDKPTVVEKLLGQRSRCLAVMDVFWEGEEAASGFGLGLTEKLRRDRDIRSDTLFLLKSKVEGGYAEKFRSEHLGYLRTFRSLLGGESCERIQFLGANLEGWTGRSGNHEARRIADLLLSLQEEQFFDLIRAGGYGPRRCRQCLDVFSKRRFFRVFSDDPALEQRYLNDCLEPYFEDKAAVNVPGSPLGLGPIKQVWIANRSSQLRDPRRAFVSMGRESLVLETALLRYGKIAAAESLLFTLPEEEASGGLGTLTRAIVDQKWNPNKFQNVHVVERLRIHEAVAPLASLVDGLLPKDDGPVRARFAELIGAFRGKALAGLDLAGATLRLIEMRGLLRRSLSGTAYDLAAARLTRMEAVLRPERGFMFLPLSSEVNCPPENLPRLQRFKLEEKVYLLFNRDRFLHNLPHAGRRYRELAKEGGGRLGDALVEAFSLDAQCPDALQRLARLAVEDAASFEELVRRLESTRIPLGLPHPERMNLLFSEDSRTGETLDFAYFLGSASDRGERLDGFQATLLEVVVSGLQILRYHVESFVRILTWCLDGAEGIRESLEATLEELWMDRGWDLLFCPDLPKNAIDPLAGAWAAGGGLLGRLRESSSEAAGHAEAWDDFLSRFAIEAGSGSRPARYRQMPPDWVRLFSLPLPLVYAPYLERKLSEGAGLLGRQKDRLGAISLIRDQFGGDPFAFQEKILEVLDELGLSLPFPEPQNKYSWEDDEDFLLAAEEALEKIKNSI